MKKIIFITILLVTSLNFGQATYNYTDYALVNEDFLVSRASILNGLDFTTSGENISWNFSSLTPNSQETLSWVNPANTGYRTSWCFSNNFLFNCNTQFNAAFNLANSTVEGLQVQGFGLTNAFMHSKITATNLSNKMIGANITIDGLTLPFTASYSVPDILYQFPMNYNDNYTNPSSLTFDLSAFGFPLVYASETQRTNKVDGWGSLTTPFGVFPNVLKMKTTVVDNSTITIQGQSTPSVQTTVTYKWFDTNYGIPVLEVSGTLQAGVWTPSSCSYIDIPRCLTTTALFTNIPLTSDFNPVNQTASVSFINGSSNYNLSNWNFGDGTPNSSLKNPTHNYTCPGVKQVTLTVTNTVCDPDQVETITLPVTITDSQNAFTTNVTIGDASLMADRDLTGTTYQWIDCDNGNALIPNATTQIYQPENIAGFYAVQLTTNGCVSISDCFSLTALSVGNFDNKSIRLLPNPTNGKLEISNAQMEVINVKVYNLLGVLIGNTLDISNCASGIYIVQVETSHGIFSQKVVKK